VYATNSGWPLDFQLKLLPAGKEQEQTFVKPIAATQIENRVAICAHRLVVKDFADEFEPRIEPVAEGQSENSLVASVRSIENRDRITGLEIDIEKAKLLLTANGNKNFVPGSAIPFRMDFGDPPIKNCGNVETFQPSSP
jgi:hypothetical protein